MATKYRRETLVLDFGTTTHGWCDMPRYVRGA